MENFGIEEDIDGITDGEGDTERNKASVRAQTLPQKEGKFNTIKFRIRIRNG